MTPSTSGIPRALDELLSERSHLTARLAKVDQAIATLQELFHVRPRRTRAVAARNGHGALSADALRAALRHGPRAPGELCTELGVTRARLRYRVRQLEAAGVIVSNGSTRNRQITLAGTRPAKEAP
jgi:hypothetical protein